MKILSSLYQAIAIANHYPYLDENTDDLDS